VLFPNRSPEELFYQVRLFGLCTLFLQMVTVTYRWLQQPTDGYSNLQMVTVTYRWLR